MDVAQLSLKLYLSPDSRLDQGALIPIFHRYIREHRPLEGLLIDVADYRHVPGGPGVMIIGHEAHYSVSESGMQVSMKRDAIGAAGPKLQALFALAQSLREGLLADAGLRFRDDQLTVLILSRLVAPNTDETYEAFFPVLLDFLASRYPNATLTLSRQSDDPRAPFGVRVALT